MAVHCIHVNALPLALLLGNFREAYSRVYIQNLDKKHSNADGTVFLIIYSSQVVYKRSSPVIDFMTSGK